jgi:hypothetical protein
MMGLATVTATPVETRAPPGGLDNVRDVDRVESPLATAPPLPLDVLVCWPATHQPRHSQCHRPPMPTHGAQVTDDRNQHQQDTTQPVLYLIDILE